ncbi:TIGR01244 family sulfur transferase [Qipengyuania spongiae]|uniref:TIGR01244 family sulfur transferase n=1 Tax=Qipengyuania spongiae TaxID=2909673 RepID=A0ABY5T001_9SPHN|nr:TIGR01244 family sulfur transferase [Qipengyuania spongiae]UVI40122.1 TIGR01244 family sulfur transferase [Qipengyuania spongiae]
MADFRRLNETVLAAPQIAPGDIVAARKAGVTLIVNNRPDGESPDQPDGDRIEAAAREAGLDYRAIPIGAAGFSQPQVDAMAEALAAAEGKTLAFCRSGTRSTLLWALAEAKTGRDPEAIAREAAGAGYDVGPVRPAMDMLAGRASD